MKFSIPFLTLLAATSTFSYTIERQQQHHVKREDYNDQLSSLQVDKNEISKIKDEIKNNEELKNKFKTEIEKITNSTATANNNVSANGFSGLASDFGDLANSFNSTEVNIGSFDKCKKVVDEYYACLPKELNNDNYDQSCDTFNSEKCQTLFSNRLSSNDACKGVSDKFQGTVDFIASIMNINCAKDEHGEYCPISKFSKTAKSDEVLTDDIVRESCNSQSCREKAISSISSMKNMTEFVFTLTESYKMQKMKRELTGVARADEIITILYEEKCIKQASSNGTETSHAIPTTTIFMGYTSKMMTTALLFTATLLFYFF